MPHQCRQLKAKRLPSASRHQDKQMLPGECILDYFFLQRPELFVAKMFLQRTEQFHNFLSKTLRAFRPANFVPQGGEVLGSRIYRDGWQVVVSCLRLRTRPTALLRSWL